MNSSRTSLPYPSFSKAHSKEAVGRKENIHPNVEILTPDPTDLAASRERVERINNDKPVNPRVAPPSPPLSHSDHEVPSRRSDPKAAKVESVVEDRSGSLDEKIKVKIRHKATRSTGNLRSEIDTASDLSSSSQPRKGSPKGSPASPAKSRLRETTAAPQRSASQPHRVPSPLSSLTESGTNPSSQATSVAPNQPNAQRPASIPPGSQWNPRSQSVEPVEVINIPEDVVSGIGFSSQPPPPPPPPVAPVSDPRVDYLLRNGGLPHNVPKNLLFAGKPIVVHQGLGDGARQSTAMPNLFEPYNTLLDNYEAVMQKNGSLAVATGYRSVARRLLDRLEAVFARDISSEICSCCMCHTRNPRPDERGISWGEILELVSGRRDLPTWPPFALVPPTSGQGVTFEDHVPMQKLDIDVPEEYRDHYIRQSKKTKQSIDKWLARQSAGPTSTPTDVDDETLTFAIITHLDPSRRPVYANILGINMSSFEAPVRAPSPQRGPTPMGRPTPAPRERSEALVMASQAIKRLYRLASPPRDPEVVLFLLNNPDLHNALATLAAVSNDEWDILISGRFDGFLRSGADDLSTSASNSQNQRAPSRTGPVRGSTPMSQNGSPSPHQGAPIALDEEMEIATLGEIERDIYQGMEALEDAFEILHMKAERVRQLLRERNTGLTMAAQRRRGVNADGVEIRLGTPATGLGYPGGDRWEAETDDGLGDWDGVSEILPDDSASNVSSARRRRPKRRTERRTPAPVSEEEEDEIGSDGTASPKKR
ncbi:putative 5-methylcytosine g t mismatch-specific dna [Phaeomoniella chlamydospora]|uniref:Putative 5-methylcytosine g t mismatch-specific dna n=1 Tax=Phaeomoniella chlamydospora TaxID=158046 RepID=A0A0G2GT23_PHACM|nr:putative 5-methylcytosine g t mismatch-specific dna [Phaeomoniella chlamydospora]